MAFLLRQAAFRAASSPLAPRGLGGLGGLQSAGRVSLQKRFLNLHEYQSKELLKQFNVRVQKGRMAESAEDAQVVANELQQQSPGCELVIKAQIHAGGRGKGHFDTGFKKGVHLLYDASKVSGIVKEMLGNNLITQQTGPEGQKVSKVLVNQGIDFNRELYLAILNDRKYDGPVIIVSQQGGMDIEQVAEETPEAIVTVPVDLEQGITDAQVSELAQALGLEEALWSDFALQVRGLFQLYREKDATQVEINPLVVTTDKLIYCVDAKLNFDESAFFRQKDVHAMRDTSMEDAREVAASAAGLNYVGLDGNIGCMVNGAGLAMATMDIIKLKGGAPANFLDVGGSATQEQVETAFKIITADPKVEGLLVNIFGGIMRCDVISRGIVAAAQNLGLRVPLVVRLQGTNVEQGNQILNQSGLNIIAAEDLDDAAEKMILAVKAAKQ